MLGLILFLVCTGFGGWRVAGLLAAREPEPLTRVERGVWTGVLGLGLWLAQGHLLSWVGWFRPGPLVGLSVLQVAVVTAASRYTPLVTRSGQRPSTGNIVRRFVESLRRPPNQPLAVLLPLGLVGICLAYSVAALSVLPVSNHDALSYHFPKAAQLMTTGAFGLYPSQDLRITYFPGNYEMLVATFLTFLHSDTSTGLMTSGPLLLLLASSYGLFKRVWRDTPTAALTTAMLLASPVLFLHLTAHKNDLLMGAVAFNALIWLGRYAVRGGLGSGLVGLVSLALAVGTKFHGLFVVLASTILVLEAWRNGVWRPTPLVAMMQAVCAAALFLLLGGVQYVANVIATGHLTGILQIATPNAINTVAYPAYWQVPRFVWMLLAAPLVTSGQYFRVPWSNETWFWPAYELYFSHYGLHVSLLIVLLPFGVWWARRHLDRPIREELSIISIATAILVGLNLLMGLRPYGSFAFIPRFLFFALPVLLVWTWGSGVTYFRRIPSVSWLPLTASLLIPLTYIEITVSKDRFSPVDYVLALWRFPAQRRDIYVMSSRAASFVDRVAGPDDTVAVDGGYDGWTYPAYGAGLSRKVEVILHEPGPYVPGPEVDWVAVDRGFSIVWGHPDFQRMSQASRYIARGTLTADDRRVYESLVENPDFKRVYYYPSFFQAVFQRVRPADAANSKAFDAR